MQNQIKATVIADSVNPNSVRITTLEIEYPRFIHSEFMTHRLFSRNSASSRAIPVEKVIEQVRNNPAIPVHWGKNQSGMQANEELPAKQKLEALILWLKSAQDAANNAEAMMGIGLHKQVVNRVLEPFQTMKVVVSSTEWENFFWLRDHKDAQPEIRILAQQMKKAMSESNPNKLEYGMWHLPYVTQIIGSGRQVCYDEHGSVISIDDAIKISCSSCAQVSYRKLDTSLEKAEVIYEKLVDSEPVHASAFEHVAFCSDATKEDFDESMILDQVLPKCWTHVDWCGDVWSGNFRGWIQYRQMIPNNVKNG